MTGWLTLGDWQLLGVCLVYLIVVIITNRGLIAAPAYRTMDRAVRDCQARANVMVAQNPGSLGANSAHDSISKELKRLIERGEVAWWIPGVTGKDWVIAIPLSKVAAGWRAFHAAERRLVDLVRDDSVDAYATTILTELQPIDDRKYQTVKRAIDEAKDAAAKRVLIEHAHWLSHHHDERVRESEFEQQRVALWLASVGLLGVVVVGLGLDHRSTLLVGALGGFLAPVVVALVGRQSSPWGVMVLSPVGGALTAVGGLLIIRMLSDPQINLLGSVFLDNSWDRPTTPIGLALALLLGFSGRLFSQLALTASAQLTSSTKGQEEK